MLKHGIDDDTMSEFSGIPADALAEARGSLPSALYKLFWPDPLVPILEACQLFKPSFSVVQVGANDGKTGDPIYSFFDLERLKPF